MGVTSVLLSGCTLIYFPYFRNYSAKPVEIIFTQTEYLRNNQSSVLYKNELLALDKKTYKKLNDSLPINRPTEKKASILAPPGSTILLSGMILTPYDTVFLKQENRSDTITIFTRGALHSFKAKKGLPLSRYYYYDYK
jgi:hypothetical protein